MKTPTEIVNLLKTRVPLFAGFTTEQLSKLVDGSHIASFEPNEAIVHAGAAAARALAEGKNGGMVALNPPHTELDISFGDEL